MGMNEKIKFGSNYIQIGNEVFFMSSDNVEFLQWWFNKFGCNKSIEFLKKLAKLFEIANPQDYNDQWYLLILLKTHEKEISILIDLIYSNCKK